MQTISEKPRLIEVPPEAVVAALAERVPEGEEVLIQVFTDLNEQRVYATQWLVATCERVIVVSAQGDDAVVEISVDRIKLARTEPLVGGGRLEIEQEAAPMVNVFYSGSLAGKFSEVARGLE